MKLKPAELLAKAVIEEHLELIAINLTDLNEGHAIHDFEIELKNGMVAALEVTSDRDYAEAQWSSLGEPLLPLTGCGKGWTVDIGSYPPKPDKWAASELSPFLAKFESMRMEAATIYPDSPTPLILPAGLSALGVVGIRVDSSVPQGCARLQVAGWSKITSTDVITNWSERFANSSRCAGERRKLHISGLPQRHLAVAIPFYPASGFSLFHALMAVRDLGLPHTSPALPPEITDLWLITDYPGVASLHVSSGGGWTATTPYRPHPDPAM
ncbi:hypothetical protein SAMN05444920_11695 [Nonomuraea solani]|uniref:Uncharacterized protein n=1 Tax=Nonomuraea solani TaxID=1144553 RepID=A0A1H6ETF7_9ACTN|nr:hypothetical protein SAMN05444920_11695 [Nonomuraea solani]